MAKAQPAQRKKQKTYHFHVEWEHDFLFTIVKDKTICLISILKCLKYVLKGKVKQYIIGLGL